MEEVKMEEVKKDTPKLSYEQLEQVAHQLSDQSNKLHVALQEANMTNIFKRMDYLFKVLEYSQYFNQEFITKAAEELKALITIPENIEEEVAKDKSSTESVE